VHGEQSIIEILLRGGNAEMGAAVRNALRPQAEDAILR
jgi:hypothetical protein